MTKVHVAVGSNVEPERRVPAALRRVSAKWGEVVASPFYITEPIDRPWQAPYWNGVFRFDADGRSSLVQQALRRIEADEGRVRTDDPYAERTLDLDLLLWDGRPASRDAEEDIAERPWLVHALASLDPGLTVAGRTLGDWSQETEPLPMAPFP